jgi:predicted nucleic acid-binding protein
MVVLAEVYRGDATDAGIDRLFVSGVRRAGLDLRTVRLAGQLRSKAGVGSAVDAIVVATAVRLGGGVVATSDPEDLKALAADHANVHVWSLNDPA